jgi:hypothetical protein
MRTIIAATAFALALGSTTLAAAQTYPAPAPAPASSVGTTVPSGAVSKGPSVWGILPWGGYGVGARFMLPLGIKPLLNNSNVHDGFALEFGADFLHWSYNYFAGGDYSWSEILPVVGVMWNIWLNENFALYPKLEAGYAFGWFSGWDYPGARPTYGGFFIDGAGGALYKLNNGLTLRAEVGIAGLKLGAGWLF